MSSLFDTEVYQRRNHTPWASISFLHFVKDMVWNGGGKDPVKDQVIFIARYRNDVASRVWFELEWTGEDGERHNTCAQDFGLLLWRAAEIEIKAKEKHEREREQAKEEKGIEP